MKLNRLLLLLPLFLTIGCSSTPTSSSEEPAGPETHVDEATFDEQINNANFIKPGYNKSILTHGFAEGEGDQYFELQMDDNIYHCEASKGEAYLRMGALKESTNTYPLYQYTKENGVWTAEMQEKTLKEIAMETFMWVPFQLDFDRFEYNEKTKAYEAPTFSIIYDGSNYLLRNTSIKFEDGVFQSFETIINNGYQLSYQTKNVGEIDLKLPNIN